jgi:ketosteroid isomerase-like protein
MSTAGPTPSLMKDINAAFNARDVDRIMAFFADDATFMMARGPEPCGRRVHGKDAIRQVLADRFKVIPDMRWDHVLRVPGRQDPPQRYLLENRRAG